MDLMSSAFTSGDTIPDKYTCDGANVSPPLNWAGVPEGTAALALVVDDPDAPNGVFSHWVLYNFRLYALDAPLELPAGATRAQVLDEMHNVLAHTELLGRYGRERPSAT